MALEKPSPTMFWPVRLEQPPLHIDQNAAVYLEEFRGSPPRRALKRGGASTAAEAAGVAGVFGALCRGMRIRRLGPLFARPGE